MSVNRLAYLDLEIKPQRLYKLDQINLACFSSVPSEHLLHTTESPQLNLISDILLSVLHNQRSSSLTGIPKFLRNIDEKLDFLRVSNKPLPVSALTKCLQKLEQIETQVTVLEAKLDGLCEQVKLLL